MLIGISGKMGVGKTTAARFISLVSKTAEVKSFGAPLKRVAKMFLGDIDLSSQDVKKSVLSEEWNNPEPMTVRDFLQKLGTDAIRDGLHPNAWVNMLFNDYHYRQHWVIDDVRFPNEYNAIAYRGGVMIRINRGGIPTSDHPSETMLDDYEFDFVIDNNGSEDDFLNQIMAIWKQLET